ncbi:phosphatase PAP2 family protein [Jatrophihabitans sp. YIM 134969]
MTTGPDVWIPPLWSVVAAVVVATAVTAVVLSGGFLLGWDHAISHVFRTWGVRDDPWPLRFTYLLTLPGQRGTVLLISAPTVAWLVWRGRSVDPAIRYVAALVLLTVAVYALKAATGRDAPPVDGFHTATGASFPSGHVANAILVWGVVTFCAARVVGTPRWLRRTSRRVAWIGPVAVVVGMTILDYHWMTDFVVGACVGVVLLRIVELPGWARLASPLDRRVFARAAGR